MSKERTFPIDKIRKDSNVILYGAGKNGKELLRLNEKIKWCNIFLTVDIDYKIKSDFPIPVVSPQILSERKDYDFILVSVVEISVRNKIRQYLMNMGIEQDKIIDDIDVFIWREERTVIIENKDNGMEDDHPLLIGFLPGGVMGDNVISLRLYQEFVKLAPYSMIDVFTSFQGFPEHVFYNQKNLRQIIHRLPVDEDKKKYDIIIQSHFEPSLIYCNLSRVRKLYRELEERLRILFRYQMTDFFTCAPAQYMNRLQWDRAKFRGYNCYTILGISGAFDIKDYKVDFPLNPDYAEKFCQLGLGNQYITFNYGASDPLKNGKQQTKVWPLEYHAVLNDMIKKTFPDIKVVQLGAGDMMPVPGADKYVLGENLEVIKYVLKNAMCHIDCEGGLVHIASQLGTKCFVVFGPTPVDFFGYESNENIVSKECKECCGLVQDWYTRCYKYERPRCMKSIKPEAVFEKLGKWLYTKDKCDENNR